MSDNEPKNITLPASCAKATAFQIAGEVVTADKKYAWHDASYSIAATAHILSQKTDATKDDKVCFNDLLKHHKNLLTRTAAELCTGCEDSSWRIDAANFIRHETRRR
ncbi:MAG: hypothetical protein V4735_00035 [Pseudomonadota bacterium]